MTSDLAKGAWQGPSATAMMAVASSYASWLNAAAAQAEGNTGLAIDYWRRAIEANPQATDYRVSLIALLLRKGELDEAWACCQKLLQLDPFNVSGRQFLKMMNNE